MPKIKAKAPKATGSMPTVQELIFQAEARGRREPRPIADTAIPNGSAPHKYHGYTFDPNPNLEPGYYKDAAQSLSGKHPNVGDFLLRVSNKLIGIPQIKDFSLFYDGGTARLTLWVWDHAGHPTALGQPRPIDDKDEWSGAKVVRDFHEPLTSHPRTVVPSGGPQSMSLNGKPLSPSEPKKPQPGAILGPIPGQKHPFHDAEMRHGVPVTLSRGGKKGGVRIKLWDFWFTAVIRWMGANGWTPKQARTAIDMLVPNPRVNDNTLLSNVAGGRAGNGIRGDIPDLDAVQEAAMDSLIGKVSAPPARPKGKNEKKMKKHSRR